MAWGLVAAAGIGLAGNLLGGGGAGSSAASSNPTTYDPYAPYRGAAAQKLNALMANPSSITQLPEYQADMQAAGRTEAAQGYTGSGNALVAAANAGGQAYQQAFSNLAMLSGAGQNPAYAAVNAANQANYNQNQNNQMWGQIGSLVGQGINSWNNDSSGTAPVTTPAPSSIGYNSGGSAPTTGGW